MFSLSSDELEREYRFWREQLNEEENTGQFLRVPTISATEILQAHFSIVDYFLVCQSGDGIGGIGPRDINLLHSAVSRQYVGYGGQSKYTDKYEICATLFYGICNNHAFHDCNKRTALLTLLYQLEKCGRTMTINQKELDILAVKTAEHSLNTGYKEFKRFAKMEDSDIKFLAYFLRSSTRDIDKSHRIITFNQLNTVLAKHGFGLENPVHNRIDIVKYERESLPFYKRVLGHTAKIVSRRIGNIGFPNWKSQVGINALKEVKRVTELTPENGYDSSVLFDGYEPIRNLIEYYEQPLRRLANK